MAERPWESEPDSLDFEAEGLPCAMRRNRYRVWCGYVGIPPEHPLYGLPTNHPLKLPRAWFKNRNSREGYGPMDLFIHAMSGNETIEEACPISLAFEVHGGVNFADDGISYADDHPPDGRWWFGFDCGHAGDYMPGLDPSNFMAEMIESMPEHVRETMRDIMRKNTTVYRDQQYVVSECQSLAAQLNAIVKIITKENVHGGADHRRD